MVYIPRLPSYVYQPGLKKIPTSILREGRSEYLTNRGEMLADLNVEQEYGEETPPEALDMQGLADEMKKPQSSYTRPDEGPNKFLSMLGTIMKPLTYLDIPIELAAEAIEGVVPGKWWGEGTAEREDFEGWKAVFAGLKGEKNILDIADEIAHAFEKRPLLAQVGLGFAYGMPISRIGTIARLGRTAKPTMYALDPAQLVFDYTIKPAVKKGWKHRPLVARPTFAGKDQWMRLKTGKGLMRGAAESQGDIDNQNLQRAKDYTGLTFSRLYSENKKKFAVDDEQNFLLPEAANDEFVVTKLNRHHRMQNAVVRLRNGLTGKSFSDDAPEGVIGSNNLPDVSPLMRSRDLALFDYEQAAFGREGQLHNVTVKELEKFTQDGWIPLETKSKTGARREGFLHAAELGPNMQAQHSVRSYINLLKTTNTDGGKNLYAELVAANAPAFKAVDVQLGTDYRPLGDDIVKVGAFAGGEDANILTPRLRFYNTHYGKMISGGGVDQPLPQNSQYLRAMAATRWAHSSDTITSGEIRSMLLHSDGSPDEWMTYVYDPEAIDTTKDVRFLFGRYFKEAPDGSGGKASETNFEEGYKDDFFFREFGVRRNSITVRNGKISSKKAPFEFDPNVKKEMGKYGIDAEEGQRLANEYALTRSSMISAAKTKKGLHQAGEAFTKAHREVTQFHENFKFQRLYHRALEADAESVEGILSFGPGSNSAPIAQQVRELREFYPNLNNMGDESRRKYEALVKVGVVLRNQDEAVQADISFKRLKNRQTLILKNLEKAGWVEKVGHGKYHFRETVKPEALADNILKYGEDVRMDRDEAWRLWGPYANASDVDDWVEMGDGWVGYERRFGAELNEDAIANFQNSYGGIQQQTRKLGHQLHAHEVMITGTVFRKGEVLNEWMQLYEQAVRETAKGGPFNPEAHPLFSPSVISKLWDGVVDPSLATESLLAMPGVASKIEISTPSLDLRWNRAINDLDKGISSGQMNPHQAMAIGAKRTREEMEDIFHAVMHVDENLSGAVSAKSGQQMPIEDFSIVDEDDIQDATNAVRHWLGLGLIDAPLDVEWRRKSAFLRSNQDLIVQAKQRRRILESAGVTDGGDAASIASAIEELIVEDIGGVAGIFGSDMYKSPGVLNPDRVRRRSERLAALLVTAPDGVNTLLGEAGFQAVVPPTSQLNKSVKQRVLAMRRPYTPVEDGVTILDKRVLTEDELSHYMPHINDITSTQFHESTPGPLRRILLGQDAKGNTLDVQNRWQKMMVNVGAYMAGGSAHFGGLRKATKLFGARNVAYGHAEGFAKSTKADLHLMLNHEKTAHVLGAKRQAPSRIHREGTVQNPTYAQGRHAVGNRFYESLKVNEMEWNRGGTDITGRWADGTEMSEKAKKWVRYGIKAVTEHDEFMEGMGSKTIKQNVDQILKAEYSVLELPDEMLEELFGTSSAQYKQLRLFSGTAASLDEKAAMSGYFMQEEIIKAAENTQAGRKAAKYAEDIYVPRLSAEHTLNISLDRKNWNGVKTNDEFWLQGRTDENPMMQMARGVVYVDAEESLGLYVGNMNKAIADQQVNHALRNLTQYTYAGRGHNPDFVEYVDGEYVATSDDVSQAVKDLIKAEKYVPEGFRLNARQYYKAAKYDLDMITDLEFTLKNVLGDTDITAEFTSVSWKGSYFDSVKTASKIHKVLNADWSHMGGIQTHIDNLAKAKNNEARARYLMKEDVLSDLRQSISNYKHTAQDAVERTSMTAGEKWQKMYNNQRVRWFSNIKMDKADLDEIDSHLSIMQEGITGFGMQAIAQGARPMSRFLRTFKAGFDAGVLLIHGYNALVKVPFNRTGGKWAFDPSSQKAWFKSAKEMVNFMRDPAYYEEYMASVESAALRKEMAPYTTLGHSEPLALITESSTFQRFRKDTELIPVIGKARVAHRAEAAFVGTLDVLRMEMWKGMKPTIKEDWIRTVGDPMGLKWSDDIAKQSHQQMRYMEEFGAVVNKATGVYDQTKSMLKPTQGTIEQSLIFFAPMYRRATYGIIADVFRGGIRRREAVRQLSGVVMAGLTMGVLAEHAFGNEGASSPDSGNFGKFVIGGQKMGIGTAWYTAFRLAADLAMGTEEMLEGDVKDYLKDNPIITALGRRGRSQLAPPAQILIDMMQGKNYIGEPLMDRDGSRDWDAHLRYAGKQVMPFWADSVLNGGKSGMLGGLAEAVGLQSMPVSDYDIVVGTRQYLLEEENGLGALNDWRAEQKRKGNKLVWSELPEKVRFDLETNNLQLIQAMTTYKEKWSDIARGDDRDWVDYASRKEDIDIESKKKVAILTMQFEKGLISGRKLNQEVKAIKQYRRMANAQLIGDPTIPAVSERFQELHKAGAHELDTVYYGDLLFDDYMATVVSAENTEDDDGMYLPDSYANNLANFQSRHNLTTDSPMWQYIESKKSKWYQENPILMELDGSKKMLDPYWNIHKTLFKGEELHKATRYLGATSEHQKALMIIEDPSLKLIQAKIEQGRLRMRINNPEYDWELVKWHGGRPKTSYARAMEDAWESKTAYARRTGIVNTPDPEGYQRTGYGRVTHSSLTGVQ